MQKEEIKLQLGVHEVQLGRLEVAKACFVRALELNPGHRQTEEHLRSLQDGIVESPGAAAG